MKTQSQLYGMTNKSIKFRKQEQIREQLWTISKHPD